MTKCIAKPLSRNNIRRMALLIRTIEGCQDDLFFDIVHFLEVTLARLDEDFNFRVMGQGEMGECHGLTFPDKDEMIIREDVYERACVGSGRDRLTMAHELFHLLCHEKENISYARVSNVSEIKTYRDPEWQADAFGGELLVPHHLIAGLSEDEIVQRCGVSISAARCQMKK